jgi:hypothetical protein
MANGEQLGLTAHNINKHRIWFGHLQRKPINSLPYRDYNQLANGFKAKGRPRKRLIEDIKDTLQ